MLFWKITGGHSTSRFLRKTQNSCNKRKNT